MLYEIFVDGNTIGQLYGKTMIEAIEKAKFIWKLTGSITAKAIL